MGDVHALDCSSGSGVSLCLLPGLAAADTTFTSANLPGYGGLVMLQPFDTSLGTLDSVEVTIDGTITANIVTQPNYDLVGGAAIPIPINYLVAGTQNFIGGGGGSGFSWEVPATFFFSGLGSGFGEPKCRRTRLRTVFDSPTRRI